MQKKSTFLEETLQETKINIVNLLNLYQIGHSQKYTQLTIHRNNYGSVLLVTSNGELLITLRETASSELMQFLRRKFLSLK